MPEYLAPGVYMEEIELGPRPIEGVSTSTTGFVGLTQRGPLNKPTLVTSVGEFERYFGSYLDPARYKENRWLPFAVQGFFANGGARAYIVRTAPLPPANEALADRAKSAHVAKTVLPVQKDARRSLAADALAGTATIELAYAGGLPVGSTIVIGDGSNAEAVRITGFGTRAAIAPALRNAHAAGTGVTEMELPADPDTTLSAIPPNGRGATTIRVADVTGLVEARWLRLGEEEQVEFVVAGEPPSGPGPAEVPIGRALTADHLAGEAVVMAQEAAPATTLAAVATKNATSITLNAPAGLQADALLVLDGADAAKAEVVQLAAAAGAGPVELRWPTNVKHDPGADVALLTFEAPAGATPVRTTLTAGVRLTKAIAGLNPGDWLAVGADDDRRYGRVSVVAAKAVGLDVDLRPAPASGAPVRRVGLPALTTSLKTDSELAATKLTMAAEVPLNPGAVIELLDGPQTEYADVLAVDKAEATLARPLRYVHRQGTALRVLAGAIRVIAGPAAPDPAYYPEVGSWGNDIQLTIEAHSVLTTGATSWHEDDPFVELETANGIEPGTVLRFPGNAYGIVNRVEGRQVFLQEGAPKPPAPEGAAVSAPQVSTMEFRLTASYAGRDEVFAGLSMDPRHSRYFEKAINHASELIHVEGVAGTQVAAPENLPLATVRRPSGGTDGLDGIGPGTFMGKDSNDADKRSGLWAMLNARVSIVAVPGITDLNVQLALIGHCERSRYRFAVLDSEEGASLDGVQKQRSRLDSKYAALYYPWLKVFDPLTALPTYAPPSGYVTGLYARTDQEVGVHKAPANAVLREVLDLQFTIGKGQQDILNPLGINAARAFPGRGIRMWGARTISSDSLWRYVNVRRLFIFLEQSIDENTQYAVFEPNDVPLWSRLKAAVTDFLTVQWRNGALQGTTAAEAFFVRCGLGESMIQADIDAGQVIMVIGVAPVKPAEFVIFRIGQKAGAAAQ